MRHATAAAAMGQGFLQALCSVLLALGVWVPVLGMLWALDLQP